MEARIAIFLITLLGFSIPLVASVTDTNGTTTVPITTGAPNTTIAITTKTITTGPATPVPTPAPTTNNGTGNGTTEPESTTAPATTPELTTTMPATTAPSEIGTWTVVGGSKNLTCMKMSFKGTITKKDADPMLIPITAVADSSSCSDEQANFVLDFEDKIMTSISVTLGFVMQDNKTSYLYSSSIAYDGTTETKVQILFETPVGNSYQCNKQMIPISATFSLTLEDLRLQPFATFAKNDFGNIYSCERPTSKGPNAAVIVGLVLGAIILILLIAIVVLYRKKKGPGRGYNNFS